MRQRPIDLPTNTTLTIDNVVEGLLEKILSIPFNDFDGNTIYPTKADAVSGTNAIEVEMSDDTHFIVEVKTTEEEAI